MRWFPLVLLLLCATACGGEGQEGSGTGASPSSGGAAERPRVGLDRSHAGAAVPDAAFEDPDGAPASLADFRGKPLLLNLWATWCAPCVKELPTLDALAQREGDKLRVVALSQDLEGRERVESFLAARKLARLEPWLDPQMKMMGALGITTLPTTILYDARGREIWRFVGEADWTSSESARLIGEATR